MLLFFCPVLSETPLFSHRFRRVPSGRAVPSRGFMGGLGRETTVISPIKPAAADLLCFGRGVRRLPSVRGRAKGAPAASLRANCGCKPASSFVFSPGSLRFTSPPLFTPSDPRRAVQEAFPLCGRNVPRVRGCDRHVAVRHGNSHEKSLPCRSVASAQMEPKWPAFSGR